MNVYMVERHLNGITMEDLAGAQKAAIRQAEIMRGKSAQIRYLRSTFTPHDGKCLCLFEAGGIEEVEQLNNDANLPFERVVTALDLTP